MLVRDALAEFLHDHKGRGSRPKTIDWYGRTITMLLGPWLDHDTTALTVFTINRALDRDVKPASLANYDRALRGFCNWLAGPGVGVLDRNPFQGRKRPRDDWQPKRVLTPEEVARVFTEAKHDKRFRYRNEAILCLFLEAGLRASEVARLQLRAVDWEAGVVTVQGKSGNATMPLTRRTIKAMRLYASRERKGVDPHLFLYDGRPLNQGALSHLTNRIGKRAGLDRPLGTHLLRHTFATTYLRNGGDGFSLQRLLRHRSPAMTSRYVHFIISGDLADKLERFGSLPT